MAAHPSRSLVWLLAGAAIAAGTVILILFTGSPAAPGTFEAARPAEPGTAAAAQRVAEKRDLPEPTTRKQAEPAAAVRGARGFDARYLGALAGIRGRVVVKGRGPLPDFAVDLFRISATPFVPALDSVLASIDSPALRAGSGRTDAGGRFLFAGLQPRSCHVLQFGAGTGRAGLRIVDRSPAPGEVIDIGDVELPLGATLSGTLADEDGAPVAGARVCVVDFPAIAFGTGFAWLDPEGGLLLRNFPAKGVTKVVPFPAWVMELEKSSPLPEATTDSAGAFRLDGVPPGRPSIWVRKKSLIPLVHGPVAAEDGKEKELGKLVVKRGEKIPGQVVDGHGAGIAGCEVLAGPVGLEMVPVTFLRPCGTTDAKGRFEVGCVGREQLMFVARRAAGDPWVCEGPLRPDDPVVLRIEEPASLRVLAVSPGGAAVRDASVTVVAATEFTDFPGLASRMALEKRSTRAEDGSTRITGLAKGEYRVLVRSPEHVTAGQKIRVDGPGEQIVRLEMSPQIAGRIRVVEDATSEPVAFSDVVAKTTALPQAELLTPRGLLFRIGTTDAAGEVAVNGLPAGSHDVQVTHPRYGMVPAALVLPGPVLTVRMPAAGSIAGILTRNKRPPGEPYVIALEQRGAIDFDPPAMTWTDAEGRFGFQGVAPGKYTVMVIPHLSRITSVTDAIKLSEWHSPTEHARGDVAVSAGQQSQVTLNLEGAGASGPTGRIIGQVLVNGVPAANLQVHSWSVGRLRTTTDAAGRFELEDVRASDQVWLGIVDSAIGVGMPRNLAARSVRVKEGETVEIQISVQTGHFRGRALLAHDGSPVAGATITASRYGHENGANDQSYYQATTDEGGRFSIRDVVTGHYTLGVQSDERTLKEPVSVEVRPGEESSDVELRVIVGFTVAGIAELVPPPAKKAAWQWVYFQRKDSKDDGKGAQIDEASGKFEVTALAPGVYEVQVYDSDPIQREPLQVEVTGTMSGLHLRFVPAKKTPPPEKGTEKKDG